MHGNDSRKGSAGSLNNICLLLGIIVDLSPSNAHVERMVKAMNHIKTTERVGLSQVRLNNLFRVSTNSPTGTNFNPQEIIDYWMEISIDADKKGQPVILHEGQVVPNIFRLQRTYTKKRAIIAKPEMI